MAKYNSPVFISHCKLSDKNHDKQIYLIEI